MDIDIYFLVISKKSTLKQDQKNSQLPEFVVVIPGEERRQWKRSPRKGNTNIYFAVFQHFFNLLQQNCFVCDSVIKKVTHTHTHTHAT